MQFVKITPETKLKDLIDAVGDANVDHILATNGLSRTPNIGKEYQKIVDAIVGYSDSPARILSPNYPDVTWQAKASILNSVSGDSEVFEATSLLNNDDWKVMASTGALPGTLKVPDSIQLPDSSFIIGSAKSNAVPSETYKRVMSSLSSDSHEIDSSSFNSYSVIKPSQMTSRTYENNAATFQWFKIPSGVVMLHSSLDNSTIDFPCYPNEVNDTTSANYTSMDEILYQYEPWQIYTSSGPRTGSYSFHIHRDMFSGNHLDGKANELIRFCQSCCYARYSGSAVNTPIVTLYIGGKSHISGVMTEFNPGWNAESPIGLDGWYLECNLSFTIVEVSNSALNYDAIRKKGIIG